MLVLGSAFWLSPAKTTHAQAGAPVRFAHAGCDAMDPPQIRALLALELSLEDPATPAREDATRADLRCQGETIELRVHEPGLVQPLQLVLDVGDTPAAARPRLIALTLAELIVSARLTEPEASATANRAPKEHPETPKPEPPRTLALWLGAGALLSGQPAGLAPTSQLGLIAPFDRLYLSAELEGHMGSLSLQAADTSTWGASLSGAAGTRMTVGNVEIPIGLGLAVGHVTLAAETNRAGIGGRTVSGVWFGPMLQAAVQLPLTARLGLRFAVDAMWIARPVRGRDENGADLYALEGLRASARASILFRPGAPVVGPRK